MKGTAILFQRRNITFIEDVEHSFYEEIKEQGDFRTCKIPNQTVDFGFASPVFWHEDEIDWDYGY
ncbi:hypothetical protein [Neobacillus cucumis]|uniref:hypothetical protein n=1 Tax=Neobacillus cucumis TaxID=1740721 RepID=UPI00285321B6|nr:hypothetical protein [Neobacillus cucumis]MDR4946206.1 hypothetical protein [Neobacillus cucumis]